MTSFVLFLQVFVFSSLSFAKNWLDSLEKKRWVHQGCVFESLTYLDFPPTHSHFLNMCFEYLVPCLSLKCQMKSRIFYIVIVHYWFSRQFTIMRKQKAEKFSMDWWNNRTSNFSVLSRWAHTFCCVVFSLQIRFISNMV